MNGRISNDHGICALYRLYDHCSNRYLRNIEGDESVKRTYFLYDDDGTLLGKVTVKDEEELDDAYDELETLIADDFEYYQERDA